MTEAAMKAIAFAAISVLCWSAVLWSRNMTLFLVAGTVGLGFLVAESYRVWVLLRRGSKRFLVMVCLGFAWVAALVLICIRFVRL
jgi:hypothetical protein